MMVYDTRRVKDVSNTQLKKLIRQRLTSELKAADDSNEDGIIISVFNTNKQNTTPAYASNKEHKFVTVHIRDKFISTSYVTKDQCYHFTIDHFLSRLYNTFKKAYKKEILENLEENF